MEYLGVKADAKLSLADTVLSFKQAMGGSRGVWFWRNMSVG